MNENINLCEILKGHEGKTFYSPAFGNIKLNCITDIIYFESINGKVSFDIYPNGTYCSNGELIIFPSKDQRDWNKWIEEQKPKVPKTWSEFVEKDNRAITYNLEVTYNEYQPYSTSYTPIEKSALALLKIHQLIEIGYGGNVTEWEYPCIDKYIITPTLHIEKVNYKSFKSHIAFHTKEQAEEFLTYPENIELLKDYFMV